MPLGTVAWACESHCPHRAGRQHARGAGEDRGRWVDRLGVVIAFAGILLHQLTGSPVPDAIGSILVGLLLGVVAIILIDRNRRFLVGMEASPRLLDAARDRLTAMVGVDSVGYLHMEFVGPRQVYLVASVDLVGDDVESSVADQLRALEHQLEQEAAVVEAVLTVSRPGDPPDAELS